jgi:hypothetical protein
MYEVLVRAEVVDLVSSVGFCPPGAGRFIVWAVTGRMLSSRIANWVRRVMMSSSSIIGLTTAAACSKIITWR